MQIPTYKQIAKYILAFGSVHGLNVLISLLRNKIISSLLGPAGLGLISLYQSGLTLVQNATNFGIAQSGVKTISQAMALEDDTDRKELQEAIMLIRSWSLLAAAFGTIMCIVLAPALSYMSFRDTPSTWGEQLFKGLDFMMLAPAVGLVAVTAGEMAVLKAVRMLKKVATLSVLNTLAVLIVSAPIYFIWGTRGIIASLLLAALVQMLITIGYSYRAYPLSISLSRSFLRQGRDMIQLGIAFIAAGILGSGAEFAIRAYINITSNESMVGLYNAGYMIAFVYAGAAFAAFENEYFPRLSTLCKEDNKREIVTTIIRQIKVSLAIVTPMVLLLIPLLPYIIPLLFSSRFIEAVPMAQVTLLAMIIRAVTLPVEYLPLAKGDSRSYLLLESVYDILIVVGVCTGFHFYGLVGTGVAIVIAALASTLFDIIYIKHRYL